LIGSCPGIVTAGKVRTDAKAFSKILRHLFTCHLSISVGRVDFESRLRVKPFPNLFLLKAIRNQAVTTFEGWLHGHGLCEPKVSRIAQTAFSVSPALSCKTVFCPLEDAHLHCC
jgi:hypothetical protein